VTRRRQVAASGARPKGAAPPEPRRRLPIWAQRLLGIFAFGSVAVACVLLGVVDLVRCAEALARGAPTASFQPEGAMTVTLFVAFFMFAAMCALSDPEIRLRPSRRSPAARLSNRIASGLFAVAGAACIATPFAPVAADLGLTWLAARHGYVRCPSANHPPSRHAMGPDGILMLQGRVVRPGARSIVAPDAVRSVRIEWRRRTLGRDELTPIGRLLFAGGGMRMRGWRLTPSLAAVAANGVVAVFLLGASLLAMAAVGLSRQAPDALAGAGLTAFFVAALALYVRIAVRAASDAWRTGTWPAPRLLAWRAGAWIDAVREPDAQSDLPSRIVRQVVD